MIRIVILRLQRMVQPELDRTLRLLIKANTQLDHALRENTALKERNSSLSVQVNRLEADNKDLHHQIELLRQANELQGVVIARMERHQKELMDKADNLFARVVQLEARIEP